MITLITLWLQCINYHEVRREAAEEPIDSKWANLPWLTSPLPIQSTVFLTFSYLAAAITLALPSAWGLLFNAVLRGLPRRSVALAANRCPPASAEDHSDFRWSRVDWFDNTSCDTSYKSSASKDWTLQRFTTSQMFTIYRQCFGSSFYLPTWSNMSSFRHLATSCIFGMPLRAKLRLCLNTILTPTASIADVLSVFKRYHTVRCFKSFRGLRLRKMELAFTGLNPVTKEVQREDQRYSHTCTYTASKPLHCESCTYTWQSQAVNLDKHVLLHLGVCLGLSQQSNRGNMQQTFFAILLLLARSKNVPSNRSNKPMDQHHKSWEMCPCPSYRGHSGHRTCRITFCVDFWPRIRVATLTMHPNAIQALSWTRPPDGRRRHAKSTLS